jgi:hypothetical protein
MVYHVSTGSIVDVRGSHVVQIKIYIYEKKNFNLINKKEKFGKRGLTPFSLGAALVSRTRGRLREAVGGRRGVVSHHGAPGGGGCRKCGI